MEEQNKLTAERSLEIIKESIEQSRRDITRGSWKSMLVWGILVAVIALVVGHLWEHTSLGSGAAGLWGILGLRSHLWGDGRFRQEGFLSPCARRCLDDRGVTHHRHHHLVHGTGRDDYGMYLEK